MEFENANNMNRKFASRIIEPGGLKVGGGTYSMFRQRVFMYYPQHCHFGS